MAVETHILRGFLTHIVFSAWLLLPLIMAFIVTIYVKFYRRSKSFMKLALQIPGPKSLPVVGTALLNGRNSSDFFYTMVDHTKNHGPVSGHWIGPEFVALIHKAADIEVILASKTLIDKPRLYRFLSPSVGLGLITASGSRWKKHRKILTPTFHVKILENYIDIFTSKSKIMLKLLESEVDKLDFDIQPYFNNCVFDVICGSAMSTDLNSQECADDIDFAKSIRKLNSLIVNRIFKPWLHPDFIYKYSSSGRQQRTYLDYFNKYMSKVITRKKEIMKNNNETEEVKQDADEIGSKKFGFLDYLLSSSDVSNEWNEKDIEDEVKTFMAAGTETTSYELGFIAYELSKHFDVQQKIVQEIKEQLGSLEDKKFSYYELKNMRYLERVIKECLRIHPSVPFVARHLREDVTLPSGYTLPKGCTTAMCFYVTHRDPEAFPNPEEFNPDHFLPERVAARHPYSYCPFSAGPRNCIGQKFAILELKAVTLSLLRKFWILPTNVKLNYASEMVLRSTTGIHVGLRKRTEEIPVM